MRRALTADASEAIEFTRIIAMNVQHMCLDNGKERN